jgi:hypothetical protein
MRLVRRFIATTLSADASRCYCRGSIATNICGRSSQVRSGTPNHKGRSDLAEHKRPDVDGLRPSQQTALRRTSPAGQLSGLEVGGTGITKGRACRRDRGAIVKHCSSPRLSAIACHKHPATNLRGETLQLACDIGCATFCDSRPSLLAPTQLWPCGDPCRGSGNTCLETACRYPRRRSQSRGRRKALGNHVRLEPGDIGHSRR